MKKYLAFIAVLALSLGCATTNYPIITDTHGDAENFVVNTNGKAPHVPSSQVITLWDDRNDELFAMIDQNSAGDQTIGTYNNVSYGDPKFMGWTYCAPDWTGCAVAVADNPVAGDVDYFDYVWKTQCLGAMSLSVLVSYNARMGECGRAVFGPDMQAAKLDLMYPIGDNYGILLTRNELSINALYADGSSSSIPVTAISGTYYTNPGAWAVRINTSNATTMRAMAQTGARQYEVCLLGNCMELDIFATQQMLKNANF
jgi:hypothetical protein